MNKYLIAGNWKMNNDIRNSELLISEIIQNGYNAHVDVEMLICPPFTNLLTCSQFVKGAGIQLGAQNCHWEESGAFTGEISCSMLKSVGCDYVIIGHSERRTLFNETNHDINKKLKAILSHSMIPILCIGETLSERQAGKTFDILEDQLDLCLNGIDGEDMYHLVIAYEPVWAIGTGVSATIEQVDEAHNRIREIIVKISGDNAHNARLLYGGSVNSENSKELFNLFNVNGALIGGAALNAKSFLQIYDNAKNGI